MTQNIYDDPEFFAAYGQLPRSLQGLDGAGEWPVLRALLPDMAGLRVLDLGCGYGWFCRWARSEGAEQVLGVDVSERMLERARSMTWDDGIAYARADLEGFAPPRTAFDLIYSSLALHYVENLGGLMAKVRNALVPGGRLVFSVEHPIFTAPTRQDWIEDEDGRRTWQLDAYGVEGPRRTNWLADGVIKQHRKLATYINMLVDLGLAIVHVEEWGPSDADLEEHPDWKDERERPPFLFISARRPA